MSPGLILTPMGREEVEGLIGHRSQKMLENSALKRAGTPEDIAGAIGFLVGPDSGYITGTDILVDGGTETGHRWKSIL